MPTQARPAFGAALRLGDGVATAAKTITAATNATPIVITTSTAHGIADIGHGTVAGVTGTTAANGLWIVEMVTTTTLKLRGSVGNAAYVSGGTFTPDSTYATIAEVRNITDASFEAQMEDVTAHDSSGGWGVSLPIMKHGKAMRLDVNLVPNHPTHDNTTGMIFVGLGLLSRPWLLVYAGTPRAAVFFRGWVSEHATSLPIGVLRATFTIGIDGTMDWRPS